MECPSATRTPAATSRATKPSGKTSGATVTTVVIARGAVSNSRSCGPGRRIMAGSCAPGFSGERKGPSRWMPSTPEPAEAKSCTAPSADRIFSGVSLIKVGSSDVVPKRRWAATMRAIPVGVGSSLNSTSPPPFTWMSTKPGASQVPAGRVCTGIAKGNSRRGAIATIRSSSTTTALWRSTASPSKMWSAAIACCCPLLIACV